MYAKEYRRPTPPKNYSGTAFREGGGSPYVAPPPAAPIVLPPALPPSAEGNAAPPNIAAVSAAAEAAVDRTGCEPLSPATPGAAEASAADCRPKAPPPKAPTPGHGLLGALIPPGLDGRHGSGLGFEELLLTGLILLLSQSDRDSDLVLMLALLLFYQ